LAFLGRNAQFLVDKKIFLMATSNEFVCAIGALEVAEKNVDSV